jgi:hypothetical protein
LGLSHILKAQIVIQVEGEITSDGPTLDEWGGAGARSIFSLGDIQGYFILLVLLIPLANEESENQVTKEVLIWVLINLTRMKQPCI